MDNLSLEEIVKISEEELIESSPLIMAGIKKVNGDFEKNDIELEKLCKWTTIVAVHIAALHANMEPIEPTIENIMRLEQIRELMDEMIALRNWSQFLKTSHPAEWIKISDLVRPRIEEAERRFRRNGWS